MSAKNFTSRIVLTATNNTGAAFKGASRNAGGFTRKLAKVGAASLAAGAAIGAMVSVSAVSKAKEFGAAMGDLASITGATGKELDFYSDAAKRMGATTTFTASQAAEAFKLVASAKPDLLANKDALNAVTEQTLLLAEAAGMELPEAAKGLGEALNQFGEGADQAARFVNVLAAGSQKGSSEIPELSEALTRAGVAAKASKIPFEETVALLETMATVGIKGGDAGTKLRAVLVKLQVQANDQFNPAVVGISDALKNLEEANLSVTDKVKIFGQKSVVVADALVTNRHKFDDLTVAVTGTNTAFEQSQARFNNLEGDTRKLGSVVEALQITMGEKLDPAMRASTQTATSVLTIWNGMERQAADTETNVDALAISIKGLAVAAFGVKEIFGFILDSLGALGEAIGAALAGQFEALPYIFDDLVQKTSDRMTFTVDFADNIFSDDIEETIKEKFTEKVTTPILESAAEVTNLLPEALTAGEDAAATAAQTAREALQTKLEALRTSLLTEQEVQLEYYATNNALLIEALEQELITKAEYDERAEDLKVQHEERLTAIQNKGISDRASFERATTQKKAKFMFGEMARLTSGVAQNNKTMFKINKISGIANAVINTAEGITKALSAAPPPFNIALAAITAAAGFAQIQAIKNTSYGGGGTGTTPSAAGSVPVVNNQPIQGTLTPIEQDETERRIVVEGLNDNAAISAETARAVIEGLGEAMGDGVTVRFR